jgi:hypothetical protein
MDLLRFHHRPFSAATLSPFRLNMGSFSARLVVRRALLLASNLSNLCVINPGGSMEKTERDPGLSYEARFCIR